MRARAYRVLCGGLGGLWIVAGLALIALFLRFHSAGFRGEQPELPLPVDAWGGGLLGAARRGGDGRSIGTASALALTLMARVRFLVDPGSRAIDALRIRRPDPEAVEMGVPHPATYVLDREGVIRFVDVREDLDRKSVV